jgi:hypothetical protein
LYATAPLYFDRIPYSLAEYFLSLGGGIVRDVPLTNINEVTPVIGKLTDARKSALRGAHSLRRMQC